MLDIKKIIHYPRLDSILIVEQMIFDYSGEFTKKQLWQKLPKKMMYQTYSVIIDYLLYSNKIATDSEGKLGWIWDPEGVKKYLNKPELLWKK